ncbi:MAG: hypothetical protein GY761_18065 [Hyphomicrobiales bacterium]|nr:hypothetical protein [Hyphomicrobiales bacterium]
MAKNIRGAIGDVLKRKRQIDETANQRPDALTALYERHLIIGKHHVPSPMTIGVYPGKNDIEVVITLFGIAGLWRENLIYAANEALEYGIRVTEGGSVYPSWELTDWYWYRKECFSLVEASDTLSIELVSPMVTGSSGGVSGDFSVIPAAIANRVRLMARWLNVGVKLTPEQIDKNARNIRVEYDPTRPTVPFVRRRMQDRSKRVTIYANASGIRFHNVPSLLRPAFLLGQTTMAGGSVVHGFGDYRCY